MPLHLIKLAVGCELVKELKGWVAERMATAKKKGLPLRHIHITRMTPKRDEEILAGGSLYWVIRGEIAAREKIIAIEPFRDKDGIGRCRLVMQPKVIAVSPRPMRPFQGWRYLTEDADPGRPDQVGGIKRRVDAGADAPRIARSRAALGGVDFKDSLLGANQIQGCFLGGSLGRDGPVGFERRGVGADGAADHRST